jgi:hypothetical protein
MPKSRRVPSAQPFRSVRGSWITALTLVFLAVAGNTSFTVFARLGSEARTRAAWVTYRPWRLSRGRAVAGQVEVQVPDPPGAWCVRSTTEGSTPRGRWSVELITCIQAHSQRESPAATAGSVEMENKEPSP